MKFFSKEDLKDYLLMSGIPDFIEFNDYYANEIMTRHGKSESTIAVDDVEKFVRNLKISLINYESYRPKTIFDKPSFTPNELVAFIDWQLDEIKDKYKPFGLKLPFVSLEDAHKWIRTESLEGILSTERISCPALEYEDMSIYKGSIITLPYQKEISNKGYVVKKTVICNWSPFLIELNYAINSVKTNTGIDEVEILNYFLCNTNIEIPRINGTIASDTFNKYFSIQINTNDITKNEWDEIYNIYRLNTNRQHKKQLSKNNMKLAKLLDNIEIPENPNAEFYRSLITRWNKETKENMNVENWRTMRNRFKTVMDYKEGMSTFNNPIMNYINEYKKGV